ncbi:septum formation initiator family protein [Nicoliella spurrieriana]|uniref:Septum formation initiator family protein n=1 Tax=Nicoliella spurrieriana TaxID=2925830 RepID=A0A976RTC8_9LACO|nr:septum formation initiator family protein [Nicoliella spurrieriana]UQS87476.1 septum formation initiator family protein [Nicoliella spurrieriana]
MKNSNVKWLNNAYTKRHYRKIKWSFVNRPKFRRIFVVITILLAFSIPLLIGIHQSNAQRTMIQKQTAVSKKTLATARAHNQELKLDVKQLNNSEYVQQLIRDKYYYTKSGETVYSLPNDVAKDVTQN